MIWTGEKRGSQGGAALGPAPHIFQIYYYISYRYVTYRLNYINTPAHRAGTLARIGPVEKHLPSGAELSLTTFIYKSLIDRTPVEVKLPIWIKKQVTGS
jgi:hypothetical protein